mgnify:FL=1
MRLLISLFIICFFCYCNNDNTSVDCIDPNKIKIDYACIEIYQPVCGCDKNTYSNSCYAGINGLKSWIEGECK